MKAFALGPLSFLAVAFAQDLSRLKQALQDSEIAAVFPEDITYENATIANNLRYEVYPVAVSYPTSADQVSVAIKAGAEEGLNVVARSGGHSYIANGLGGANGSLVVDLSNMTAVTYNSDSELASVQGGIRLGDLALALNDYGRAIPHGRCTYVGIGGLAGHGGFGYPSRMWGLTLDVIDSVTVVLADGSILTASDEENAELFWALRGSASSIGIITEFRFKTFPAPPNNTIYIYSWPELSPSNATSLIFAFQNFTSSTLQDTTFAGELFIFGGASSGTLGVNFTGAYYGDYDNFNSTIEPFLSSPGIPEPAMTALTTGDYITGLAAMVYGALNTSTVPDAQYPFYMKSLMTPEDELMTEETVEAWVEYMATEGPSFPGMYLIEVELWGGPQSAINQVDVEQTAFANRNTLFTIQFQSAALQGSFPDMGYDFLDGMVATIVNTMPDDWDYGAYANYIDDRLENWQGLYYGPHYDRLSSLKSLFDPENVFQFPLAIQS